MKRFIPLAALPALILYGCTTPMPVTGGPCKYETSIVSGKVFAVHDHYIELVGDDGSFPVENHDLGRTPELGDIMTFSRQEIVQGTCTPVIYTEVTDDPKTAN